ncbi:prepilin-type N-terminal cleavage/methylation domain-containing protein [Thiotrichales bacterium 19S9-12]|nr:prepilin-type N-terminal cleavage/methylation domain-containing protein [Thiotrichales bacterium 19S9-11]MCF6811166.1 prepilin-type N-terminal cleavage/methylation domain-containing protein [Thiotrichales bacterium 19S9-12]
MRSNRGFSLVEILIAISLGSLVMALAIRGYSFFSRQYQKQIDTFDYLSSELLAIDVIQQVLNDVGFMAFSDDLFNRYLPKSSFIEGASNFSLISGIDSTESIKIEQLGLSKKGSGQYVLGNDVLVVYLRDYDYQLDENIEKSSRIIYLPSSLKLKPSDTLAIAIHDHTELLKVKKVTPSLKRKNQVELEQPINNQVLRGSYLSKISKVVIYIGLTKRLNQLGNTIKSLYIKYHHRRYEVVSNIEHLKFQFLVSSEWVNASHVDDWTKIKAVELVVGDTNQPLKRIIAVKNNL